MLPEAATVEAEADDAEADDASAAVEAQARAKGWRPKDEYEKLPHADPKKWIDAAAFLKKGEEDGPILRAALRKMEAKADEQAKLLKDIVANQRATVAAAVKDAVDKLNAQKDEAIAEGDVGKVKAIDAKIEQTKADGKTATEATKEPEAGEALPEEFNVWAGKNPWFTNKKEPAMRALAIGFYDMLHQDPATSSLSDTEKLALVTKEVRARYPEKFARAKTNGTVEGATHTRRGEGEHSFADLPKEAQDICDRLVRQKVVKSREDYIKAYPW